MKLKTNAPEFYNEISESIRAFIEADKIELTEDAADIEVMRQIENGTVYAWAVYRDILGESREVLPMHDAAAQERVIKRCIKLAVYFSFKKYTGRQLPWGSLTGIRPTKLAREYSAADGGSFRSRTSSQSTGFHRGEPRTAGKIRPSFGKRRAVGGHMQKSGRILSPAGE